MKCTTCGTENRDSAEFCSLCGTVFDVQQAESAQQEVTVPMDAPVAASQPKSAKAEAVKHCTKCNAVLMEGASFCTVCGATQSAAPQPIVPQAAAPQPAAPQPVAPQPFAPQPVAPAQPVAPYMTQPIAPQAGYRPVPIAPAPVAVRVVCGTCGKPMAQGEAFCNKCGTSAQYNKTVPVKKQSNKALVLTLSIVGGLLALIIIIFAVSAISTSSKYNRAIALYENEQYYEALVEFNELGSYQDAYYYASQCQDNIDYNIALDLMNSGNYREAKDIFDTLYYDYYEVKDSRAQADICQNYIDFEDAEYYYNLGYFWDAYELYDSLGSFKGSNELKESCLQERPDNGIVEKGDSYYISSSATIVLVNESDYDMYIKVYQSDTFWCSVYVKSGSRSTIYVPSGDYYFHDSIGSLWFGAEDMFGGTGRYKTTIFSDGSVNTTIPSSYIFTVTYGSGNNYFFPGGDRYSF